MESAGIHRGAVVAPSVRSAAGLLIAAALAITCARPALADDPPPAPPTGGEVPAPPPSEVPAPPAAPASPPAAPVDPGEQLRILSRPPGFYGRIFGTVQIGKGLRFNNPYRLATQIGQSPEGMSVTPSYVDLGAAFVLGAPDGLQHGAMVHFTTSIQGISQQVITPSYVLAYRTPARITAYGRLGPSFILTPDPTFGAEIAGGFGVYLTARLAISSELVFDLYYGAGTHDKGITTYPILSGQIGLLFDYEVLP